MTDIQKPMPAVAYRKSLPVDDEESLIDVELPVPRPGPHDLLVRVEAVAVNPVDFKVRQNTDPHGEPKVLGWDAAGTVVATGDRVALFEVGDEVYYAGAIDRPGADSRFHAVDERVVARKPATLSFAEAAALPLTSLTAWEGLFEQLGLRHAPFDQTGALLVTAAAGGVGAMVTQLILTRMARLVDRGVLTTTATRDLGAINAAHLREAHRILESGTAIGKITLTGF
ncbi:alcohol dehydrogenase catalytic domain-containing protein [Actinomadura gamaensis]|uniref:Alcohol dehydrogenase catalytic domain-containing protein n=1 Tax=Actinomadura gamaensis TaxID=1763541 RepID=A0ABV9TU09_9ACTN